MSGLKLWLRADSGVYSDAGVTPATNGVSVYQWNDSSGNGEHAYQGNSSMRPTYIAAGVNGRPTLRFNGVNSAMATNIATESNFDIATPSIFVVNNTSVSTGSGSLVSKNDIAAALNAPSRRKLQISRMMGTNNYTFNSGGDTPSISISENASLANIVSVVSYSLSNHEFSLDGSTTSIGTTLADTTYNNAAFEIGSAFNGISEFFNGDIAEIIVYNRAVTSAERDQVTCYLSKKYNITVSVTCP